MAVLCGTCHRELLKGLSMPNSRLGESRYSRITAAAGSRDPDRRRSVRDSVNGEPPRSQLVMLVLVTYDEIPGLSLSLNQAARLFGLRETTCLVLLDDLVREGRLRRSDDGHYYAFSGLNA
jgi:hypothetical protein